MNSKINTNPTTGSIILDIITNAGCELTQYDLISGVLKQKGAPVNSETTKKMQPNVSKALKTLIKQKKVSCTEAKTYTKYSDTTSRVLLKKDIIQTIKFQNSTIFSVSPTTLLLSVSSDSFFQAKELLKAYLGNERCFDIFSINEYLVVLLNKNEASDADETAELEELKKIRLDLQEIVHKAIEEYRKKTRKTLKLIKENES